MIIFAAIPAAAALQLTVCGWLLPSLSSPTRPFDAPVPDNASGRALSDRVCRRYRLLVVAAGAVVTAVAVGASWHATVTAIATATTAAIATLFLSGWLAYCHARATLQRATAHLPRGETPAPPTTNPTTAEAFPARWVLPVVALPALTLAIGAARYHHL